MIERTFPIQQGYKKNDIPPSRTISWADAEIAYRGYSAMFPSSATDQSLERLAQRGGFGWLEYQMLRKVGEFVISNPSYTRAEIDALEEAFWKSFRE